MKNLVLQSVTNADIALGPAAGEDDPISHFCLDSTEGLLYAVTRSGLVLCLADDGKKLLWSVPLFEEPPVPVVPDGQQPAPLVVAFCFVLELDAVFVACSSGELLLLYTGSHAVEEVGVVAGGIAAADWSPDGELLVVLGYNKLLLMMNKEWDVLAEVSVPAPDTTKEAANTDDAASADPQIESAALTWRGDSKYFATNTLWSNRSINSSTCRLLHIWDREDCQLHATAQAAAGLAAPIAWQPNSRHLYAAAAVAQESVLPAADATAGFNSKGQPLKAAPHQHSTPTPWPTAGSNAQQQQQQQQHASSSVEAAVGSWLQHVLLYERNGLQHGGFDVPTYSQADSPDSRSDQDSSGLVIQALHWSSDSELLAVVLAPAGAGQQRSDCDNASTTHEWHVQLWHRSNWHWYLKHEHLTELPDSAGCLVVLWDDTLPMRLHMLAGSGSYTALDYDWDVAISGRGTAAVIDGHTLLITPLRLGQVPPPMCAVRAVLPRPANAVAWLDGNVAADLGVSAADAEQQQGSVDVVEQGLCEVLAVLLSDGQLVFLRAVESDLWEETLEDQAALGGPKGYLLPLGHCPAVQNMGSAAGSAPADLSMPAGPWNPLDGSITSSAPTSRPGSQVVPQQHQKQQQRLLPVKASIAAAGDSVTEVPAIPLAEGRMVTSLVWLSKDSLLLLAAPYPAEEGLEDGEGTVLVQVNVTLPSANASLRVIHGYHVGSEPETQTLRVGYAGAQVLAAAPHPAGGAVLQLQNGQLVYYSVTGQLVRLPAAAVFKAPCKTLRVLPNAPLPAGASVVTPPSNGNSTGGSQRAVAVAATAPVLGLSAHGVLYWGQKVVATDVTSVAVRGGGPGGPAVLYTTRQALLYVVMVGQLPTYVHTLPDESLGAISYKAKEYPGDLKAAMAMAMRPGGAAAAARDPHVRAVEQGAMVLACPWGDVGVILQMQRGNLEGISPRLLMLAAVCDALERRHYARAWDLAVTHRVDLNLIVDYAWPRFVAHAADFVAAVPDASDLCDLLLALKPESVLQQGGVYSSLAETLGWQQQQQQGPKAAAAAGLAGQLTSLSLTSTPAGTPAVADDGSTAAAVASDNKVSVVCEALRTAVLQLPGRYLKGHLKTVVMSYARSEPPSLESALIAIREVKESSVSNNGSNISSSNSIDPSTAAVSAAVAVTADEAACPDQLSSAADAALRHLLLYVDVDQLYKTALGLYDLALAFMVVGHSQKDPGEYLAELTGFGNQSDERLRCHAIDMSLYRYDRALTHLVAAGAKHFDAALKLAKDKGLLRQLLALIQQQQGTAAAGTASQPQVQPQDDAGLSVEQRLVAVLSAYGDALMAARKPEDAAVAFSAAGLTEQALGAYKAAGAWRMCMVLASRLSYTPQQQQALARDLAEQLQASGSGADAAQLLVQYLSDVDGAVAALVAAKEWREALRVAYAAGRADLVDTIVVPGAAQSAASMLADATDSIERLGKYTTRLVEVRQRRVAMEAALAAAEADAAAEAPDDDLASDAGASLISGFSMYTDRTSAMTGIGGSSVASSSRAPSTIGGRKPLRHEKKAAKKGKSGKIRAGSPGEEVALAAHLATLAPPKHVLEEAGQLSELLVMLQHVADAAKLQQRVGQWQAAAAAAMEEVAKGQQQQGAAAVATASGGPVQQQPGGAASATAAAAAASQAAAAEVRWKWDVLREHK